jgi:hypothetical protein
MQKSREIAQTTSKASASSNGKAISTPVANAAALEAQARAHAKLMELKRKEEEFARAAAMKSEARRKAQAIEQHNNSATAGPSAQGKSTDKDKVS